MIRRLLVITVLGVTVSGCFMAPLALLGPVSSGFSTASLIQSGVTSGANYVVKKSTGKTIAEHAITSLKGDIINNLMRPKLNLAKYWNKLTSLKINLVKDVESMIFIAKESSMIILLLQNHCYPK